MCPLSEAFTDDPITSTADDYLARGPFVAQLVAGIVAAARQESSTVFGLVGPWGSGKTSVLKLLEEQLQEQAVPWQVAHFNPWSYPDETAMQLGFFAELGTVLPKRGRTRAARRAIADLSRSLAPAAGVLGMFAGVNGRDAFTNAADFFDVDRSTSTAFAEATRALQRSPHPVLVVIDDLDRLDPSELVLVAKLVRLVGRLPNVFYVLSYDEATLLDVLRRTALVGEQEARAKQYLEKIVQVRFDLPPLRPSQAEQLLATHLTALQSRLGIALSPDDQTRFRRTYDDAIAPRLQTVRGIHRFFAQLDILSHDIAKDVDVVDFVILTWIRVAEPRVYGMLHQDRDWALGNRPSAIWLHPSQQDQDGKQRHNDLRTRLRDHGVAENQIDAVARVLGALFPAIRSDIIELNARLNPDTAETKLRRIADADYFHRFFAYLVPEDDVSDQLVDQAVDALNAGRTAGPALDALRDVLITHARLVGRKLQQREPLATALATWLLDSFGEPPHGIGSEGAHVAVVPLLQSALLRLPTSSFALILERLTQSPAGRRVAIGFGRSLTTGRDLTAMYERVPLETVEGRWSEMKAQLPALIEAELRERQPANAYEATPDYMHLLFLWDEIEPGTARRWLRERRTLGEWTLLDELALLVPKEYSSLSPDHPVLKRTHPSVLDDLFDPEEVAQDLREDLDLMAALPDRNDGWPATRANAYLMALHDARDFVDRHRSDFSNEPSGEALGS
jgi:type II secretory pathway predicted ATPase ExeA